MGLILPDVSITVGPTWATMLNAISTTIDSHGHTPGQGVAIVPSAMNINADLTFNQNNATNLRTARLFNNTSFTNGPNDLTALYALNNELYYIDGAGNEVQITLGGAIDITGSITTLFIKDSNFVLEYFGDTTKRARFDNSNITSGVTRIFSFPEPGGNDTLVSNTSTSVLTNKTLKTTTSAFADATDTTKQLKVSLSGMTTGKTVTLSSSATNNRTITLPDVTDTVATIGTTQTFSAAQNFTAAINMDAQNPINFYNSGNTFFTSLAGGANTSNYSAILPVTDGSSGQVISTNGSGQWAWSTVATTVGNVAANDSNVVFTNANNRHQISTPTTARTYTLPTTGIPSGDTWLFENTSNFLITINASGGALVGYNYPFSQTQFVALSATPTVAANWDTLYVAPTPAQIAANDSAVVFLNTDNRIQICTPTAARTYTMPAALPAGVEWTFYNKATSWSNVITLQSSGSNTICIIPPNGFVTIVPLTATPTTAGGWFLKNRESIDTPYTPSFAGLGTVANVSFFACMHYNRMFIQGVVQTGTPTGASVSISLPSSFTWNTSTAIVSGSNNVCGTMATSGATASSYYALLNGTSNALVYAGFQNSGAGGLNVVAGSAAFGGSIYIGMYFSIPVSANQ